MWQTLPIIGKVFDSIFNAVDKSILDKTEAERMKQQIQSLAMNINHTELSKELESQKDIIIAEAKGESWLQRNWRPMLMTMFGAIVANNYIVAPYMQALTGWGVLLELPPGLWDLLKLGVGGYVIGRSVEKGIEKWRAPQ